MAIADHLLLFGLAIVHSVAGYVSFRRLMDRPWRKPDTRAD